MATCGLWPCMDSTGLDIGFEQFGDKKRRARQLVALIQLRKSSSALAFMVLHHPRSWDQREMTIKLVD